MCILFIEQFRPIVAIEIIDEQLTRFGVARDEIFAFFSDRQYTMKPLRESESLSDPRVDAICLPL
jgi:hypothetical protein